MTTSMAKPHGAAARCATCPVHETGICHALEGAELDLIGEGSRTIDHPANHTLPAGDGGTGPVWILRSGYLRVQRHGTEGHRQIVSLILPGETVGDETRMRPGTTIETATRVSLCRIDRRLWEDRLRRSSVLRHALFAQRMEQLERLRWLTWSLGALALEERMAAFLALGTRFLPWQPEGAGGVLTIPLCRADIADYLGTTVESISRTTRRLDRAGTIEILDPARFRIPDLNRLIGLGCIAESFGTLPFRARPVLAAARMTPVNAGRGLAAR